MHPVIYLLSLNSISQNDIRGIGSFVKLYLLLTLMVVGLRSVSHNLSMLPSIMASGLGIPWL